MIELTKKIAPQKTDLFLQLPYEVRRKSRFRARLSNGDEVVVDLPRGHTLRDGDFFQDGDGDGRVVGLRAAAEEVSTAYAADTAGLVKGAYHLGNRHVPIQLGKDWLRYKPDHVLDQMLESMGFEVRHETTMFEPEGGAYAHSHP